VHSTQFEIREPGIDLFEPVLRLASVAIDEASARAGRRLFKVAGVCGRTPQAQREAVLARDAGYDACLLSLAALADAGDHDLLAHCRTVAEILPLVTIDVVRAVCEAGRAGDIALYTGNRDCWQAPAA
jgi:hypothetical protein